MQLIRMALNLNQPINSQMMTPVQRITRYPLLLKEAARNFHKSGDSGCEDTIKSAQSLATIISDYCNDMMIAGRMNYFPVSQYAVNNKSEYVYKLLKVTKRAEIAKRTYYSKIRINQQPRLKLWAADRWRRRVNFEL